MNRIKLINYIEIKDKLIDAIHTENIIWTKHWICLCPANEINIALSFELNQMNKQISEQRNIRVEY